MESDAFFQEKVYLTPTDLKRDITSIDAVLVDKLRQRLERRCTSHGYVLPDTIELLTRSAGMVDSGRFTGEWAFLVKAKARVLHPPEGTTVDVEILKFNKMGIYAVYKDAIRIMVPRDLHLGDEEFDGLKVGEVIRVEIQKSRFQLRDQFIVSVGVYRGRAADPALAAAPAPRAPAGAVAAEMAAAAVPETEEEAAADDVLDDGEEEAAGSGAEDGEEEEA
jgi:hypothetical protein